MARFYYSRETVIFHPDEGDPLTLVEYGVDKMRDLVTEELSLPADDRDYVAAAWGNTVPRGNARKTLVLTVLLECLTVAHVQMSVRAIEAAAVRCRTGYLERLEAYHQGVPAIRSRWRCCITGISTRMQLPPEESLNQPHSQPTLRGKANAEVSYNLTLWSPERL